MSSSIYYNNMATKYGRKLNQFRRLRELLGVKGIRQSVVITNNPSTIDQNQMLTVRFPNLDPNYVIVPGFVFCLSKSLLRVRDNIHSDPMVPVPL